MVPMTLEAILVGILIIVGAFPATAESAIAGAVFPLDVYFDLKQNLAFSHSWPVFAATVLFSVVARSGILASTLWLAERRGGSVMFPWGQALRLAALGVVLLAPSAVFMYLGVALRYAPFIWIGAIIGFVAAVALNRRALGVDAGIGTPRGRGVPEAPAFLAYGYMLCAVGAAMSSLGRISPILAGLLVMCLGPLHALFLLGWREHLRAETYPGGGSIALAVTVLSVLAFGGFVAYDRAIRNPSPTAVADAPGTLLLLGGADSTSETGALTELDPRDVGFPRDSTRILSYAAAGDRYKAKDTRADLEEAARRVARQIERSPTPRLLLGHSQAALILDRMIGGGLAAPDRSVVLAPPPPVPPPLRIPEPGRDGPGRVGGDVARAAARLFGLVGSTPFDVDAPASPTNLRPEVVIDKQVTRVGIWALGDSVWLDADWRRPGEVNLVALTDHVGITNNSRALGAARSFLAGRRISGDDVSWRGFLVAAIRYAFEPWRPG
jgi:hypothetical protein